MVQIGLINILVANPNLLSSHCRISPIIANGCRVNVSIEPLSSSVNKVVLTFPLKYGPIFVHLCRSPSISRVTYFSGIHLHLQL
jgi:hypothetical protein